MSYVDEIYERVVAESGRTRIPSGSKGSSGFPRLVIDATRKSIARQELEMVYRN